jgi:alpha-ketoglutarate-dependent taurine dioxygenase
MQYGVEMKSFAIRTVLSAIETIGYFQFDAGVLADPNKYLLDLVSSFATPLSYFDQPIIMDVTPKEGAEPASYAGRGKLDLHTDISWFSVPPKYVAMMCIHPGDIGGVPLVADGFEALADLDPVTIELLKNRDVSFAAPSHVNHSGHTAPIISMKDKNYQIRFRSDLLRDQKTEAIDLFSKAIDRHALHLTIAPGSVWILDNYRILHGRTSINGDLRSRRFLKRIYASDSFRECTKSGEFVI